MLLHSMLTAPASRSKRERSLPGMSRKHKIDIKRILAIPLHGKIGESHAVIGLLGVAVIRPPR
jgi:hypothetical protein